MHTTKNQNQKRQRKANCLFFQNRITSTTHCALSFQVTTTGRNKSMKTMTVKLAGNSEITASV
jgi:hypothetical protein